MQLAAPGVVMKMFGLAPDQPARRVTRMLGARHLAQAAASAQAPTAAVLALGVEVDLLHAVSMIALAVLDRRQRRAALTSAAVAGAFAVAGALATSRARHEPPGPGGRGSARRLRDQWAERLARSLVPAKARSSSYRSLAASG